MWKSSINFIAIQIEQSGIIKVDSAIIDEDKHSLVGSYMEVDHTKYEIIVEIK